MPRLNAARVCAAVNCFVLLCGDPAANAQGLGSLKTVGVPAVPNLDRYVRNNQALLVLGKALFWDMHVGSDGHTACGTCHFHAGADHRVQNQLSNPGGMLQPNHQFVPQDFPFRVFAESGNNRSSVLRDSCQRAGSAGVVLRELTTLTETGAEGAIDVPVDTFQLGNLNVRQVSNRNAPTVINAIFNVRNFRDGRASDIFSGRTPFGDSDPARNAIAVSDDQLVLERVRITNSSLASQAVAPPVNTSEMSYRGRSWPMLGRKMLELRPLSGQTVAPDDGVLGSYANPRGRGLATAYTYLSLVQAAFQPAYWNSRQVVDQTGHRSGSGEQFTVAEFNFSLFFGLAIQAYESTLVADDSPFDQFANGKLSALTAREVSGFLVFQTRAFCPLCHGGPELTNAGLTYQASHGPVDGVFTGVPGSVKTQNADTGFFSTGVRPSADDPGLNASDDFGVPLSLAARASLAPSTLAIDGAFKVPGLRNVEFTGPYFHNGGQATLEQVIDFYARGGDFPDLPGLPVAIIAIPLTISDRADLVAFLKSLSDDRVRYERAPFDHPEICVPIGYPDVPSADPVFPFSAVDRTAKIPAVGRNGNAVPLQTFEELLQGVGADGTRAHTLTETCAVH